MKKLSKIVAIFLNILFIWACKEKTQIITPTNNTPLDTTTIIKEPDPTLENLLVPSPTKEPFVEIPDRGFEAELIASGIDKDNQVNGKIALEDALETKYIGFLNPMPNDKYPQPFDYGKKMEILATKYKDSSFVSSNGLFIIKNITGIEHFKNIVFWGLNIKTDTLDLSKNTKLVEIQTGVPNFKHLNISGCKDLIKLDVGASYMLMTTQSLLTSLDVAHLTSAHFNKSSKSNS